MSRARRALLVLAWAAVLTVLVTLIVLLQDPTNPRSHP